LSPPQKSIGDGNFLKGLATMFVPSLATLKPTPPSLKELQWDGHLLHKEQNQHINVGDANEKKFMEKLGGGGEAKVITIEVGTIERLEVTKD
jgi:hypothetical protein